MRLQNRLPQELLRRQMLKKIARKNNIQTPRSHSPFLRTILLQYRYICPSMPPRIRIHIHSKLPRATSPINKLAPPTPQIQDCRVARNPPRKVVIKHAPNAQSILRALSKPRPIHLPQFHRRMCSLVHLVVIIPLRPPLFFTPSSFFFAPSPFFPRAVIPNAVRDPSFCRRPHQARYNDQSPPTILPPLSLSLFHFPFSIFYFPPLHATVERQCPPRP